MRKTKKALAVLAIVGMVFTMVPMQAFAATGVGTRISGTTQYDTAVEIAKQWPAGTTKAVLAYGGSNKASLADALAAGPLAAALGAPILLTDGDTLTPATVQELKDLGVTTVYVTSGTSVIKKAALDQLATFTVKPVWGQDAPATSVEIAKAMATATGVAPTAVAVANGAVGAQDALSVASIASAQKFPILISDNKASLPKVVKDYLATLSSVTKSYAIGGTSVISDAQKSELTGAVRLSGNDAYDTNAEVIKAFSAANSVNFTNVFVANGETLVDALSGAPLAAKYNAVIALTDGTNVKASATVNALVNASSVITALGGVNAVPAAAVGKVAYNAPAKLSVEKVSAINSKQLQVVFNQAVDKDTVVKGDDTPATAVEITRIPVTNDSKKIDGATMNSSLSDDGKTLTLTADGDTYFDGTYTVFIDAGITNLNGGDLGKYNTTVSVDDKTAPKVSSISYNSSTNMIDVNYSEPIVSAPSVTLDGKSVECDPDNINATKTEYSYDVSDRERGVTVDVIASGAIDYLDNDQADSYSKSVKIEMNESDLKVTSVTQKNSNTIRIVFDKTVAGVNAAAAETAVKGALTILSNGKTLGSGVYGVTRNHADDSSNRTFDIAFDAGNGPDYAELYTNSNSSAKVSMIFGNGEITDVFGNTNLQINKDITMNKVTTGPLLVSSKEGANSTSLEVRFDKSLTAVDHTLIAVRKDGVLLDTFEDAIISLSSDKVIQIDTKSGDVPDGTYTIHFSKDAVTDEDGNTNAALNTNVVISGATTVTTKVYADTIGTNKFTVAFSDANDVALKVGNSAIDPSSYTLNGNVLSSGTDIYFNDSNKTGVTIELADATVSSTDANATLRNIRVYDADGNKVAAKSNAVSVTDNIKPTLVKASLSGNIMTLTFSEDMVGGDVSTLAKLISVLEIKGGTDTTLNANAGDGPNYSGSFDGKTLTLVLNGAGNWASVKAFSTIKVKTLDTTGDTSATLGDGTNEPKDGTIVTVIK